MTFRFKLSMVFPQKAKDSRSKFRMLQIKNPMLIAIVLPERTDPSHTMASYCLLSGIAHQSIACRCLGEKF